MIVVTLAGVPASANPLNTQEALRRFDAGRELLATCHDVAVRTRSVDHGDCEPFLAWLERDFQGLVLPLQNALEQRNGRRADYIAFLEQLQEVVRIAEAAPALEELRRQAEQQ